MAVKPFRDLTHHPMTLDGLGCSESFKVLHDRWGDSVLSAVPTIGTIKWTLGPTIAQNYGEPYPQSKEEMMKPSPYQPDVLALTYNTSSVPVSANTNMYGRYAQVNTANGNIINLSGSTFENDTLDHYVIGNFDRSRFILVCAVSARNLTGQTWNGSYGDYAAVADQYPYVTQINPTAYYKQDLAGTSQGVAKGLGLITGLYKANIETGRRNDNRAAQYRYDGYVCTQMSGMLTTPPQIISQLVNIQGTVRYASWLNNYNSYIRCPYEMVYFMQGVTGEPSDNYAPFCYFKPQDIAKYMNAMGLWWADSRAAIAECHGAATVSEHIHVPQIDKNGFPTGVSFSGEDISEFYEQGGDSNSDIFVSLGGEDLTGSTNTSEDTKPLESVYEDVQDPEPLKEGDEELELANSDYNGVGLFGTYFATSRAGVKAFSDCLWNDDGSIIDRIISGLKLFADPIDAVISLRLYPFRIPSYAQTDGNKPVYIGTYDTGMTMNRISESSSIILDLGSMVLRPKYNNFLDLAPYTAMTLYIPFVGCIQLNPNDYLGETLRVQMTVDMTTGQCVAAVYASEAPLVYASGQMGVDIPVTCKTGSQLAAAITTATAGLAIGALGNMVGVASKAGFMRALGTEVAEITADRMEQNAAVDRRVSAANEIADIAMDSAMLYFGATSMDRTGTNSPANGMTMPISCFLTISRPTVEMPDNYNHTYGKVCHVSDILANFTGFTVCANVDTSGITATEQERSAIKSFLESGVYV